MNTQQASKPIKKAFWLRWPFLLTAIPLSVFLVCLIALAVREKLAMDRVEAELARLKAAGQPIDDSSMAQWFLERTSQEGTAAWGEILRLVAAAPFDQDSYARLPYVCLAPVPAEI